MQPEAKASAQPEIILDLSRLLSRILRAAPTGVDRVEMTYANALRRLAPERLRFAAFHPFGLYGRLPLKPTHAFIDETSRRWARGDPSFQDMSQWAGRLLTLARLSPLGPLSLNDQRADQGRVYVQASPHHLHRQDAMRRMLRQERAKFICLVHDLIPIDYPEYARPGGADRHRLRMDTVAALADAVLTVSQSTQRALSDYIGDAVRRPSIVSAPLGAPAWKDRAKPAAEPYFVMLGTIEPRKNHLLILNAFRQLAAERGPRGTPKLYVAGARGWENESVIDMLERSPALRGVVFEQNVASDDDVKSLLLGARALLMPSFAEGFGLPVVESLQIGTPVVSSNISALREIGRDAPDYLDPTDGPAWRKAIMDYSDLSSPRRADQMRRLATWRAPTWDAHFAALMALIDEVSR